MNFSKASVTIALLTDFGNRDGFVGVMKGVMCGILTDPGRVFLIDLGHEIAPQNVWEGAWVLGNSMSYFPQPTIFLCVVDPHVGSDTQAHLLIHQPETGHFFIGPDNGLFTPVLQQPSWQAREIINPACFWQIGKPSRTFHGRDVYAPAAAHLANALLENRVDLFIREIGLVVEQPVKLDWDTPVRESGRLTGQVMQADRFGNLITNLPADWLEMDREVRIRLGGEIWITKCRPSYDAGAGESLPFLIHSSTQTLELSLFQASALQKTGARIGQTIEIFT